MVDELEDPSEHTKQVQTYLRYRAELHDSIRSLDGRYKDSMAEKYNRSIKQDTHRDSLVMLHQKKSGKLEPRWRGPSIITIYGGSHGSLQP